MRSGSLETYAARISRVIDFVQESIEQGQIPNLADLAGVAALSEYHFHRVFRLMVGETPAEAISRIRLSAALGLLEAGDLTGAVAASGYATSQAFARAMRDRVGASPTQLRKNKDLLAKSRSTLSAPMVPRASGRVPITVEIATVKPIRLLARRNVGDFRDLNIGYGLLFETISQLIDPSEIRGIYGIPLDDPRFVSTERCRFDCAFDVGDAGQATDSLFQIDIAAGRFAGLHHQGDYGDIHARIDDLYSWAVAGGHAIADRPLFIHYLDDPDEVQPPAQKAVVWLPLEGNDS